MDTWLAEMYGTGPAEDLEKTAQMEMLSQLAEQEGVDLSQLSDEELEALAAEVLEAQEMEAAGAEAGGEVEGVFEEEVEGAQGTPDPAEAMAKEAQAKFEEADFLGRVMAHAYTQELEKIAGVRETAGKAFGAVKGKARGAGRYVKGKAQYVGGQAKARVAPGSSSRVRKSMDHVNRNRGRYAAGAGAAGGAAAGYAVGKRKEASAFEKLAEQRALEILEANGIDPNAEGAETEVDFEGALNDRALQILAENGYAVE